MRALILASLVAAAAAHAASIAGTMTLTPGAFNAYGGYDLAMSLDLTCSLSCTSSAPQKHFGVNGGADFHYAATGTQFGYLSTGFTAGVDPSGSSTHTATSQPAGARYLARAVSATCWCGNATGQGGYVDIDSNTVTVAPLAQVLVGLVAGSAGAVLVTAAPQGSETVTVHLVGAGIDVTNTLTATDFNATDNATTKSVAVTPTQPGDLTVTATLEPYGVSRVTTVAVGGSGGGGGGSGGSGAGGGGGGGAAPSSPGGCGVVPGPVLFLAALLPFLSRRRSGRARAS